MRININFFTILLVSILFSCQQKDNSAKDLAEKNLTELKVDKEKQEVILVKDSKGSYVKWWKDL